MDTKQEKYELVITADSVSSTEKHFDMNNLGQGDKFKPLDCYFQKSSGEMIRRNCNKGERRNSNQTLPRLAFQVFEKDIINLSVEEKEEFPVCQYSTKSEVITGIFTSIEKFRKYKNSIEYLTYSYDEDKMFVIYCWNVFSTIIFVKECLKRFGEVGDQFILIYRDKDDEVDIPPTPGIVEDKVSKEFINPYSKELIESKNIILRGAPGTGKSYLAKEIAVDIISNGYYDKEESLTEEQKMQMEFVQFHPSYDYTDFVEGLRPKINNDGSMGFELQDGVFKKFIERAKKNVQDSKKSIEECKKEGEQVKLKPYVFVIDEINRGEISKIFGELFFSIDPGYRGLKGAISTQYSNLHSNPSEKFYIPENVYVIGTMNDIDRSVDSFDFAMRRRFRFIEVKADERLEMLEDLGDLKEEAIQRMSLLNNEISKVEELNENYHIGASYFLKLRTLNFDQLWTDYLSPLLQDYIRGMYDESGIMRRFAKAYGYSEQETGAVNDGN